MRRLAGAGLIAGWTVALALCGLGRYFSSSWFAADLSDHLGAHLGGEVSVGSARLSGGALELSELDLRSDALDLSVEEVKLSRTECLVVRPTLRLKKLEASSTRALSGRAEITGLRIVVGEHEMGPFKGKLGPGGLDLYCSDPVPIRLGGPLDDLTIALGPVGLKGLVGATGRFVLTARRSRKGLSGEGELTIAELDLARWAGLSEFSGGLKVREGPGVVLEQYGDAKVEIAGTVARLSSLRARWAGGPVEGEAKIDAGNSSARVQFTARFLEGYVTLERVRVEGRMSLPAGEGLAAVFEGAAEGWAEFLSVETRGEMRLLAPVRFELTPEGGPPWLRLGLGGKVGLRLLGRGRRTGLSGRVEGLTLRGLPRLGEGAAALSFDFSLSQEALAMEKLAARGESGWEGRGAVRLDRSGAGSLEGSFEIRGIELPGLCEEENTKLLSPGAKAYRVVVANGPLGALRLKVESGAYDLDFRDKGIGVSLEGVEVDIVDEAVIDLRR